MNHLTTLTLERFKESLPRRTHQSDRLVGFFMGDGGFTAFNRVVILSYNNPLAFKKLGFLNQRKEKDGKINKRLNR